MTSEATVPEAAPYAWEYAKDNGDGTYSIHIGRLSAEPPVYEGFKPKALYLTAALPHLSTAIRDAALEEAALKLDDLSEGYAAGAENTRRNWISPDNSHEDNEANRKDAAAQDAKSRAFSLGATAIRALKGKSIPVPAEGNEAEAAPTSLRAEINAAAVQFVAIWAWRETQATDAERLSVIKYHPVIKEAWDGKAAPAQAPGELASMVAAEIMGNDHLRHLLDEQQQDEVHADIQTAVSRAIAALTRQEQRGAVEVSDAQIKYMVDRFLNWPIPAEFDPDAGISFEPIANLGTPYEYRREPVGTNLFDASQAEAMVRHMVEGLALAATPVHQEAGE